MKKLVYASFKAAAVASLCAQPAFAETIFIKCTSNIDAYKSQDVQKFIGNGELSITFGSDIRILDWKSFDVDSGLYLTKFTCNYNNLSCYITDKTIMILNEINSIHYNFSIDRANGKYILFRGPDRTEAG